MTSIFKPRKNYRPFEYPVFHEFHKLALHSPWSPYEVDMAQDVIDFNNSSTVIQNIAGGISRGFTLTESVVNDYWASLREPFPKPEIISMISAFTAQEANHGLSYNHLDSTLGLDSYKAFQSDPTARKKLEFVEESLKIGNYATRIAIFSGGIEGVSLYGSFAVLLSLNKLGLFKGMSQILSWSVLDEELHSKAGIELVKTLEFEGEKLDVYRVVNAFKIIVENEHSFLENVFKDVDSKSVPGAITLPEAKAFVSRRAEKKLIELGIIAGYAFDTTGYETVAAWFYSMTQGTVHNDFFALQRNGGGYTAKLEEDYSKVNIKEVKEMLKPEYVFDNIQELEDFYNTEVISGL